MFFFHGLEGSPQGTKSRFLRKRFPDITIPQLTSNVHERVELMNGLISEPSILIGSSLGGLSTLVFAMEKPELVAGMVLLAPAVGLYDKKMCSRREYEDLQTVVVPEGIPTTIIAAEKDDVIPMDSILALIERSDQKNLKLIRVNDNHSLNRSLSYLLSSIKELMEDLDCV